jgi:hypothetical protein
MSSDAAASPGARLQRIFNRAADKIPHCDELLAMTGLSAFRDTFPSGYPWHEPRLPWPCRPSNRTCC